jgi:phage-related protein
MGTELRQLTETGFNLAEALGITNGELEDMMSRGEISFEDVRQGFINATTEGGKFYNLMENQSQTFQGQVSNLKDEITLLYRELGEVLLPVAKVVVAWARETLIPFLQESIQWIKDHKTEIKDFFTVLWEILKVTVTVISFVVGAIIGYFTDLGKKIHTVISTAIDVFYWFRGVWVDVSMFVRSKIFDLVQTFETMKTNVTNAFKGMYDGIVNWLTKAWDKVKEIASKIKDAMDKINPFHKESPSLVENVQAGVAKIMEAYQSLGNISLAPIQHQLVGAGGLASGSSVVQNINVYPSDGLDMDTIVERLAYKYRTAL